MVQSQLSPVEQKKAEEAEKSRNNMLISQMALGASAVKGGRNRGGRGRGRVPGWGVGKKRGLGKRNGLGKRKDKGLGGNGAGGDVGDDGGGESKGVPVVDDASSVVEGGSISNNPVGECASAMYGEAARNASMNGLQTGKSAEVTDKGRSVSMDI
jgi:hypothetical protein